MVRTKKVTLSRLSTRSSTRASTQASTRASTRKGSIASTASCDSDGFAVPAPVTRTFKSKKKDLDDQFEAYLIEHRTASLSQITQIERAFALARIYLRDSLKKPLCELFADYKPPPSVLKPDLSAQKTLSSVGSSVMQDRTNLQYSSKSVKSQSSLKNSQIKSDSSKGCEASIFKQPVRTRNSVRLQQQQQTTASANKYVTPMNTRPMPNMPAVTPKVNMDTPLSIIRRPRAGEFAMSITGSPLMVSAIPRDEIPSVCVPLPDGTVLSILPNSGISAEQFPFLTEDLRAQLEILLSNLTIITGDK